MDVRSIDVIAKYNEAKCFVEQYERAYALASIKHCSVFDMDIWSMRYWIQSQQDYLKKIT